MMLVYTHCFGGNEVQTMAKVLTYDGTIKIGAYKIPERKKPCLCIEQGNSLTVYGSFIDENSANEFMDKLGDFVNAKKE